MPETIPPLLAPYLQDSLNSTSLALVTSTLSTPANWLLVRLLLATLDGADEGNQNWSKESSREIDYATVIFVSPIRSQDLWIELCKKVVSLPVISQRRC